MPCSRLARIALRGNAKANTALDLGGRRKHTLSGWLNQVALFYNNLLGNTDMVAAMGKFGYTIVKLTAEQALVQAVVVANQVQEDEKGDAQTATKQRDAKLDELAEWMADFKAIAEVALEDNAQWMEKLGLGAVP